MNANHPTGLGEPKRIGKKALFIRPADQNKQVTNKGVQKPERRIRTSIDLTRQALKILQNMQHKYRLRTGKALPLWKAVSDVIEKHGEAKEKGEK